NTVAGKYVSIEISNACTLTTAASAAENNDKNDAAYTYQSGLVYFSAECEAEETTVVVYQYGVSAEGLILRKFNPSTGAYFTIEDATLTTQTIDGQQVAVASYTIVDNGPLDLNPDLGLIED